MKECIVKNDIAQAKKLLEEGVAVNDLDEANKRPLTYALENGFIDLALLLLDHGAISGNSDLINECLIKASCDGHVNMVSKLLLLENIDVNVRDEHFFSPLMHAALNGHNEVAICLLSVPRIDVNISIESGLTPLILAASNGHSVVVYHLLQSIYINVNCIDAKGRSALMCAAENGHSSVVNVLLSYGLDIQLNTINNIGMNALMLSARGGHIDIFLALIKMPGMSAEYISKFGDTILTCAVQGGNVVMVNTLIKMFPRIQGVNKNSGVTVLMIAAMIDNADLLDSLLNSAYINFINNKQTDGRTALMIASQRGNVKVVRRLLSVHGINVNIKSKDGFTALMYASQRGYLDIVVLLIYTVGIKIASTNNNRESSLTLAAANGHKAIVDLLRSSLSRRDVSRYMNHDLMYYAASGLEEQLETLLSVPVVNVNCTNQGGYTPLMIAALNGHLNIVKHLLGLSNTNSRNRALLIASMSGKYEVVEYLLPAPGIEVDFKDFNESNAFDIFCFDDPKHANILELFLQKGWARSKELPISEDIMKKALKSLKEKNCKHAIKHAASLGYDINKILGGTSIVADFSPASSKRLKVADPKVSFSNKARKLEREMKGSNTLINN